MNRKTSLYLLVAAFMSFAFVSCNEDDDEKMDYDTSEAYAVAINSFNLRANDSVLVNLDSVFFSIDLDRAEVFNADSLPLGTKVNRLQVEMGLSAVKKAEITMPGSTGADTIVNYLTNSTDSIDFSRGFVKLRLVSHNEEVERQYTIKVNVHKMKPDSLSWGESALAALPSNLSAPTAQKTVELNGEVLCFTSDGTSANRATTQNIAANAWQVSAVTLPSGVKLETLTATESALYVVGAGDALYKSGDAGSTWSDTGVKMHYIYGGYGDVVVGNRQNAAGDFAHVTYPATTDVAVDADCPVEGTSDALVYTSKWSDSPMMVVLGGVKADGSLCGDAWAYDGSEWAKSTINGIPPMEGVAVVPYFTFKTASNWVVTEHTTLLAIGGKNEDGACSRQVYTSVDRGVHWVKAGVLMQLPENITAVCYAQPVVMSTEMSIGSQAVAARGWCDFGMPQLPSWFKVVSGASRATAPIEDWECPYIYMFGGVKSDGSLNNAIWRGVINRLTFKPLQ